MDFPNDIEQNFLKIFYKLISQVNPKCWRLVSFGWLAPMAWGTTRKLVVLQAVGADKPNDNSQCLKI